MHVREALRVEVPHQAQLLRVQGEAAELGGPAQLPVEDGQQLFHQRRLAQQRAELAGGALPFDAAHFARELHLLRGAHVVAEVLQHARAHRDALADVERRRALAVEEIHAG